MRFDVFTLFPEVFPPYLNTSILERARQRGLLEVNLHNIRDWTTDRHKMTDDVPYGGGGGMIMKPEPIFQAIEGVLGAPPTCPVLLLTPQGRLFNQEVARELAEQDHLALISGRYEGVDERVRLHLVDDEISIGDYILTGGELGALVIIDALTRLVPGVLGDPDATQKDSFSAGRLEYPHYTRPANFRGWMVPDILRSGDHGRVGRWRREQGLRRTWMRRPDLLADANLTPEDEAFLASLARQKRPDDDDQ